MPQQPTPNRPHLTDQLVDLTDQPVVHMDINQLVNHTVFNRLVNIQATTTNKNHSISRNADQHQHQIHAHHMAHNTIHCQAIHIVTFNVHSNVYLSNHAQLTLFGINVLLVVIGQQLLHMVVIHRTVAAHLMEAVHHMVVALLLLQ